MARRRKARFTMREIVRVRDNERTASWGLVGLVGTVAGMGRCDDGTWSYGVMLPKRRRLVHSFYEDDLESTGRVEPPPPGEPSVRLRVTEQGDASVVNEDGTTSGIPVPDETHGLRFFNRVELYEFKEPGDLAPSGVIVGRAEKPDGTWHYAVMYEDAKQVIGPMERDRLHVCFWTEPGVFLDFGRRPPGIDDFERDFPHFLGAWLAPAPAFGYDQEVRVLDRPHTEEVAGRVGAVMSEELHDDFTWGYWVLFHDDPAAPCQSVTVAQEDLEPTGRFGEGYNPPPDWLR